jgi:uncharacterized protein YjiS (DUF1127 family)
MLYRYFVTTLKGPTMAHMSLSQPVSGCVVSVAPKSRFPSLHRMFGAWRQRRQLGRLPDHLRRDIGLTDHDVAREATRPVWDVPATWRY